jgi:hypothetical protein
MDWVRVSEQLSLIDHFDSVTILLFNGEEMFRYLPRTRKWVSEPTHEKMGK